MVFMKKIMDMKKSSKREIFLSIIVLFSISLMLTPLNGYAEEIDVKSVGLDKTTIITFCVCFGPISIIISR